MTNKEVSQALPQFAPLPQDARLDSWKEIAAYLRRGTRTVQRWEREEGLPVHRLQHEKLGSAYAYKSELDGWFARRGAGADATPAERAPSVAVLPFADMSQQEDQTYFCDGIAEEIINALSRIAGLKTASRTSSFRFRAPGIDSREVARRLAVQSLLEGSVRKSGNRMRIAVQLVDAASGFPIWTERYDRTFGDLLEVQDEIAASVAAALKVKLTPTEERELRTPPTADIGAYDYYLRGRKYYYEYSPRAMELAIRMFLRAIILDPNYAQAYAGLADCWSYLYLYSDRSEEVREQADWASSKAREMDPRSAQAQASRGLSLSLGGRIEEAGRAFDEAVRLDPELFEAHYFRARHCFVLGRLDEAADAYAKAMESRPDDFQSPLLAAQIEDDLGRHERATALRKRGIGVAERHLQANPDDARALYMAANGLAALGHRTRSRQLAERALAIRPDDPMLLYNVGCIFSLLGQTEPALDLLEEAARKGLTQKGWYEHDSDLNPLRADPRFQVLLQNMK
ncbi:MAG: TPR end-of-group domain-containing protein [Bryobacteraceae bacterium]